MTVIVWDGKLLAADRQATAGEMPVASRKIHRLLDGRLAGHTAASEYGLGLVQWLIDGADPAKWPAYQRTDNWARLIVIETDGRAFEYEKEPYPQPVLTVPMAWGSGRDVAMGALEMGATAEQAVAAACKWNVFCGMGIDVLSV